MKFLKVQKLSDGLKPFQSRLVSELVGGKNVLWLVTGGSNIPLSVAVMAQLPYELTKHLTIMLTDERYGEVGHADSNAFQLENRGFQPMQATFIPVLCAGLSLEKTSQRYGRKFAEAVGQADVTIGQFGIGADGHIAGILPGSDAVSSIDWACGYNTQQYRRVTLTPTALLRVTAAYAFVFGMDRHPALERLVSTTASIDEQPAQLLRQLPEAYVYNDHISAIVSTDDNCKQGV